MEDYARPGSPPGSPHVPSVEDYADVPSVRTLASPPKMSVSSLLQSSLLTEGSTQTPVSRQTVERKVRNVRPSTGQKSAGVSRGRTATGRIAPYKLQGDNSGVTDGPYVAPPPRRKYTSRKAKETEERMTQRRKRIEVGKAVLDGVDLPDAARNYQLSVEALSNPGPRSTHQIESLLDRAEVTLERSSTLGALSFATHGEGSLSESVDRIRTYTKMLETHNLRHFVIWQGRRLEQTPEFAKFRKRYAVRWTQINQVVGALEDLCLQRRIMLALVDGNSINELADQDLTRLKVGDLLKCIHNLDATVDVPNGLFKRSTSRDAHLVKDVMAMRIQALCRGRSCRTRQVEVQYYATSAICLQAHFRRRRAYAFVLRGLLELRKRRAEKWDVLKERLTADILDGPRVEIHVASLNYGETARLARPRFRLEQAQHLARVLRAVDSNTHVVYVSPIQLPEDVVDYYRRLLSLGEAGSGDPAQTPRQSRFGRGARATAHFEGEDGEVTQGGAFTVVVPELADRFPASAPLAQVALCSPACVKRLRYLAHSRRGAPPVVIPGVRCGWAERQLALLVDAPLLGPDPPTSSLYATRSGAKRVLHAADVNVPSGAHDIYGEEDLVVALAKLIAGRLEVERWRFATDNDNGTSGRAFLDVADVDVVADLRAEKRKLTQLDVVRGEAAWCHPDVQTLARRKLLRALRPALVHACVVALPGREVSAGGSQWADFMELVNREGAVVEAQPTKVVGRCAVHALLKPGDACAIQATQDIVLDEAATQALLATHPANKAPRKALEGATRAVGAALRRLGGCPATFFTVQYVIFETEDGLRLWATELDVGLTHLAAGHSLHVCVAGRDERSATYALLPSISGAGLEATSFATFFKLCRAHGCAFDVKKRRGPVVALVDSLASGVIGACIEGLTLKDALRLALLFLKFVRTKLDASHLIHREARPEDRDVEFVVKALDLVLAGEEGND